MSRDLKIFDFKLISKFRSELMGIAIIGVLIGHVISLGSIELKSWMKLFNYLPYMVHTEGFLFLSGFGLFYSFYNGNNVTSFYKKRLSRLLLPFILMSFPYFFYLLGFENLSLTSFFLRLFSFAFWVEGNYCGMWYIAISVFLYLLYPLFFKMVQRESKLQEWLGYGFLIILFVSLSFLLKLFMPDYYAIIEIGFSKIPIFIIGMMAANLSIKGIPIRPISFSFVELFFIFVWILSLFIRKRIPSICLPYVSILDKMIYIPMICLFFNWGYRYGIISKLGFFFRWIGKYTLELYVLHLLFYCFLGSHFVRTYICNMTNLNNIVLSVSLSVLLCVPIHDLIDRIINKKINRICQNPES